MADEIIKERKVEKQVIIDEKEEWPTDTPASYTEITKIEEMSKQRNSPEIIERIDSFLDKIEFADTRKDLNEIKRLLTDTLLNIQINDEKIETLKKRLGSIDGINLAVDEIKDVFENKTSSIEGRLARLEERTSEDMLILADEIRKKSIYNIDQIRNAIGELNIEKQLKEIKYALEEIKQTEADAYMVKGIDEIKSRLSLLSGGNEELEELLRKTDEIKEMIDKDDSKVIYKEIDLLGTMLDEKISEIGAFITAKTSEIEGKIDELGGSLESIKKIKDSVETAGNNLASNMKKFDNYYEKLGFISENIENKFNVISSSSQEVEAARKNLVKSSTEIIDTVSDEVRRLDKRNARSTSALQRHVSALAKKSLDAKKLEREVIKMNMRFAKLDEIDILMKIIDIRKALRKKKLPAWAKQRRDYIEATLRTLEAEAIDISIARELKGKMTLAEIRKITGYPTAKLKARLTVLVKDGILKTERKGKRVLYFFVK